MFQETVIRQSHGIVNGGIRNFDVGRSWDLCESVDRVEAMLRTMRRIKGDYIETGRFALLFLNLSGILLQARRLIEPRVQSVQLRPQPPETREWIDLILLKCVSTKQDIHFP
jgi:hypothetical protein